MSSDKHLSVSQILSTLNEQGWIPLRQMGILLGYKEVRSVYQRQKGKNAIPIIQVGGTKRVYEDAVVEILLNLPEDKLGGGGVYLRMFGDLAKRKQREKDDA